MLFTALTFVPHVRRVHKQEHNGANMRKGQLSLSTYTRSGGREKSRKVSPLPPPPKTPTKSPPPKPMDQLLSCSSPRPAAARTGRRDDACVGARGQAGRGSVLQRTLVPAVPWLYAQARRGVHGDQGHGQGAGDCVCVERPRRGGL
jgi:hypothetical protein